MANPFVLSEEELTALINSLDSSVGEFDTKINSFKTIYGNITSPDVWQNAGVTEFNQACADLEAKLRTFYSKFEEFYEEVVRTDRNWQNSKSEIDTIVGQIQG